MGGTRWSDDSYSSRTSLRATGAIPSFGYDKAVRSGTAKGVHSKLDPKGVSVRESRDSDANPNSVAVAVFLDVTGSMHTVPIEIQKKLPQLMGMLQRRGFLTDPHIMIGAVGDAVSDQVPLQVGQFEAGIEIDDDINNLFLEGNGGGTKHESYELAMYFLARHTSIDCFEKRGKKGYVFIVGDEKPYDSVTRSRVEKVIGDSLEADIPTAEIVQELQQRYEVFFINPNNTSYFGQPWLKEVWKNLLGQNFIELQDPNGICELIASIIGANEGFDIDDINDNMKDVGTSLSVVGAVSKAVAKIAGNNAISVPTSNTGSGLE